MRRLAVVMACATLTTARSARAQTASSRAASGGDTVVVTGTRTPELSQRATVKTDVVTREEASKRGAVTVADALSTQPSVRVDPGAYGAIGNPSAIQIQGFDLQRVLILEDGEPMVGDVGGAINLASLPLGDIERIELVTGPASALYGSSAIGGVVNVITAAPRDAGPSGRVRLEGRSYRGVVAQAGAAYKGERAWVSLDGNFSRQDGIEGTAGLPDLQLPETTRWMFGARAGIDLSRRVSLRIRTRWFEDTLDGLSSKVAPSASGPVRYLLDQPNETHRKTLHLIETINLGGGSNLRITLGRQWIDNTTASTQRGSIIGERHDRSHRMQSFESVATIADGVRTWVFGARAEAENFEQTGTKTESLSTGVTTIGQDEVTPQTLGRGAVYGQLQWKLGEAFTILPGVRAEAHSRYGESVTPRLAVSVRPAETVVARASVGRGFRAPSSKELGFVFDHSTYGYRVLGNDALRPETSWGTNADVTWKPSSAYTLRAGGFANWVHDLINIDTAGGQGSGATVDYRYANFGEARTFGAQVSAGVRLGDRYRAEIAYDYLWTRDDVNDRPLGGRPPHTLTASLQASLFWTLEAYVRTRISTDAFVDEQTRSPGYQTVDLRLEREVWSRAQAYVGVLNATDVHQVAGLVGDFRPPLGRVFYAGLQAVFPWENGE